MPLEKCVEINQWLRMSVIRFQRECEKLQELNRKIETIRQQLIEANMGTVWKEVIKYSDFGLSEEELVRAGIEGITKATFKFNHNQGYRFGQNVTKTIYEKTGKYVEQLREEKKRRNNAKN